MVSPKKNIHKNQIRNLDGLLKKKQKNIGYNRDASSAALKIPQLPCLIGASHSHRTKQDKEKLGKIE